MPTSSCGFLPFTLESPKAFSSSFFLFFFPFLPGRNMSHALPSLLSEEGFALPFSLGHSGRRIGGSKRNTLEDN